MKKSSFNWHNLLMLACIIPMIAILIYFTGGTLPGKISGENSWFLAMVLICPLMHFVMMRGMNHGKSCHHEKEDKRDIDEAG